MKSFRADLHIHTVLSPCGSLDMSPRNIVDCAIGKKLDIIGITDHNSTKHCQLVKKLANKKGLFVLCGVEITTKEEVHCLAFFEDIKSLLKIQEFIDVHLLSFPNDEKKFGYQVVVDDEENIIESEKRLLTAALDVGIETIEKKVHELNGIFIPAHIDKGVNSIFTQLGFIPSDLRFEALGITKLADEEKIRQKFSIPENLTLIRNSDAHDIGMLGSGYSEFWIEKQSFNEIKMAMLHEYCRYVTVS